MITLPPQPQVNFVVRRKAELREAIGHLVFEDGEAYAIAPEPVGCRFVVRLEKDKLEQKHSLGLLYFVHRGDPIDV